MPVLSYSERERLVRSLLGDYVWIVDLYDDAVVFEAYSDAVTIGTQTIDTGKLYQWKYSITDAGAAELTGSPVEVARQVKYQKVKYSGAFAVVASDQEWVYREGKVWELAYYADKLPVTEAELDQAIANFKPVPINLEHESTPLDGKLGMWERIWRVGNDVMGRLRIPKWLDELFKGEEIKTSVEFTMDRRFCGIALCNYPRVADAAIFAAFKAQDKGLRQEKPNPENNVSRMNWIQKLSHWHKTGEWPQDPKAELDAAGFDPETAATQFSATTPNPGSATETAEQKAIREQAEARDREYRQHFEAAETRNLLGAAKEFCRAYIDKKKMLPAEVPHFEALYAAAVRQDAGLAKSGCFASDGSAVHGANVKTITDLLDARPDFFMVGAAIQGDPNSQTPGDPNFSITPERKQKLLTNSRHYVASSQ